MPAPERRHFQLKTLLRLKTDKDRNQPLALQFARNNLLRLRGNRTRSKLPIGSNRLKEKGCSHGFSASLAPSKLLRNAQHFIRRSHAIADLQPPVIPQIP